MELNAEFFRFMQDMMKKVPKYGAVTIEDFLVGVFDTVVECGSDCMLTPKQYHLIPELEALGFKVGEEMTEACGQYRIVTWDK